MAPSARTAIFLLTGVILIWGLNWPVMKVGVGVMPPLTFVATRLGLAALCLFALLAAMGRLRLPKRSDWVMIVTVALCQMVGFLGLVTLALQWVDAGRSAILAYTTPLWVIPFALLFLGERLAGLRLIGSVAGLLGVAVMFNPAGFDWGDRGEVIGNGLLMLAAALWAVQILIIKQRRWSGSALDLAPWQMLLGTALILPAALILEAGEPIRWGWMLVGVVAVNGPLATGFCFVAAIMVNQALPAITTSLAMLGVPLVGLVSSILLLGEPVDLTRGLGLGLIAAGLALMTLGERRATSA